MKRKVYPILIILASVLMLFSCKATPESGEAKNMTAAEYTSNKVVLDKTDVAQAFVGTMDLTSAKGLGYDAETKTISYTVDKPIFVSRAAMVEEKPELASFLPVADDFWIVSGKISLSFKGLEYALAKDLDDLFPISEMTIVIADNEEGTQGRVEVSIAYNNGVGTLRINNEVYKLSSLKEMEEYAEVAEEIFEVIEEETLLGEDEQETTLSQLLITAFSAEDNRASFTYSYEDVDDDDDELFRVAGEGYFSVTKDGNVATKFEMGLSGKVSYKDDDDPLRLTDADYSFAISVEPTPEGRPLFTISKAEINGVTLWYDMIDDFEDIFDDLDNEEDDDDVD